MLLGVAALGRPNLLILAPVFAWWAWRRQGRALGPAVALLAATGVGILPATLHNLGEGKLVLVSANAGANLWTGARPEADGVSAIPIGIQWDDLQLQAEQAGARGTADADAWLLRRSLAAMAAEPLRTLGLTARRTLLLVNAHEGRNNIGAAYLARTQGVVVLQRWWPGFWLVAPLALLGLAATLRPRWFAVARPSPDVVLLLLALAGLAVAILPFFVNARFRQPMLPLLAPLAAHGLLTAATAVRARGRPALIAGGVVLASLVVVNVDWFALDRPENDAIDELNLAGILARGYDGHPADLDAVYAHLGTAARLDPSDPDVPERWGLYLQGAAADQLALADQTGRAGGDASRPADAARRNLEQALELHRRAITLFPRSFRSYGSAGNAHVMLGQLFARETAGALAAGDTTAARARAVAAASQFEAGMQAWQAALQLKPSLPGARESMATGMQILRALTRAGSGNHGGAGASRRVTSWLAPVSATAARTRPTCGPRRSPGAGRTRASRSVCARACGPRRPCGGRSRRGARGRGRGRATCGRPPRLRGAVRRRCPGDGRHRRRSARARRARSGAGRAG